MTTTTIPEAKRPATRELRGIALFERRGDEIRFDRESRVWLVPSQGAATSVYEVTIGRRGDVCECADFEFRGGPCVHIHAATIARSKTRSCAGCSGRFRGRDLFEVGAEDLSYFEGDELCRECARGHLI
jgi:hypothetical protein